MLKSLTFFLLMACLLACLLVCPTPASARQIYNGSCSVGGTTVAVGGVNANKKVVGSFPGCTVTVYLTGSGGTKATIYADYGGDALSNPFTANSNDGSFFFWADDIYVDVQVSGAGIAAPVTIGSVPVFAATGVGTVLPATCNVGDVFFLTTASSGSNLYGCTAANTWTAQAGGGGGSSAWSALTPGTNTMAGSFYAGNNMTILPTGTGVITANSVVISSTPSMTLGQVTVVNGTAPYLTVGVGGASTTQAYLTRAGTIGNCVTIGNPTFQGYLTDIPCSGSGTGNVSVTGTPTPNTVPLWSASGNNLTPAGYTITGSGTSLVTSNGPSIAGANLNTPSAINLANATNLPTTAIAAPQGNGAKVQLSVGSTTTNDCAKYDANGNIVDSGSACGAAGVSSFGGATGAITLGGSGALAMTGNVQDIVTAVVPLNASANTITGAWTFQQLRVTTSTVAGLPTCNGGLEGQMRGVTDAAATPVYNATATGGGSVHIPVYCNGTSWTNH